MMNKEKEYCVLAAIIFTIFSCSFALLSLLLLGLSFTKTVLHFGITLFVVLYFVLRYIYIFPSYNKIKQGLFVFFICYFSSFSILLLMNINNVSINVISVSCLYCGFLLFFDSLLGFYGPVDLEKHIDEMNRKSCYFTFFYQFLITKLMLIILGGLSFYVLFNSLPTIVAFPLSISFISMYLILFLFRKSLQSSASPMKGDSSSLER